LADLPDLIARHRDLGMTLEIDVDSDLRIPGPLSRAAYRICAEALSNAAKHAEPGPVGLRVRREAGDVVIRSRSPTGAHPPPRRDGHGLAGLRETVAVFGGRLAVGPEGPDWVLDARLPAGSGDG
jgi:signal transduction histidine kinase